MRRALVIAFLAQAACFSPPAGKPASGVAGTTLGATGSISRAGSTATVSTGTSSGVTTGSTGSGTTGGSRSSGSTGSESTSRGGSSSSGTTGPGAAGGQRDACGLGSPCPNGGVCELVLAACSTANGIAATDGGRCHPAPSCAGSGCSCTSDDQCDASSACVNGTCEGFGCAPAPPPCPAECTPYYPPHTCEVSCVCSDCPGPDGGLDAGCFGNSAPQACIQSSDCPSSLFCEGAPAGHCVLGCTSNAACAWGCSTCNTFNPQQSGCGQGVCNCEGPPGISCCPSAQGTVSVDLENDPSNCGACWNACGCGQVCRAGQCEDGFWCGSVVCSPGEFCYQACSGIGTQPAPACASIPSGCDGGLSADCLQDAGFCADWVDGLRVDCTICP